MRVTVIVRVLVVILFTVTLFAVGEPESRTLHRSYDAEGFNRVEFELPPETILRLRTSTEPVISIDGTVTMMFKESMPKVRRLETLEGIQVIGKIDGRRLVIVEHREGVARSGWARWVDAHFDLTITVPEWTNVEVRQRNGSVEARGGFGSVSIGMRFGKIDVAVPKNRVKELNARTRLGEVKADLGRVTEENEGFLPGETRYENPDGSTRINLAVTVGDIAVELRE